ncbi:MAG: urea amidolyase associated protein UAAP1 [Acidimicrobiia bacterium]
MSDSQSPGTSTLEAARDHARGQAGIAAETQATIPSTRAVDLPEGVTSSVVVWDETLGAGGYSAITLPRHAHLRITDLEGDACIGLVVYNARQTAERLNVADTVKVQWQAYLTEGAVLLSDLGRALATVVADTSGRHDALCGATTQASNERRYGAGAIHSASPATRELFKVAAARHGLTRRDLPPSMSLFKSVRVAADGRLTFDGAVTEPGRYVELRADLDLLILLANAPHPLDERAAYTAGKVRLTAWRSEPPADPIATAATPERARAYENSVQYIVGSSTGVS